jgi:hypothetical protein
MELALQPFSFYSLCVCDSGFIPDRIRPLADRGAHTPFTAARTQQLTLGSSLVQSQTDTAVPVGWSEAQRGSARILRKTHPAVILVHLCRQWRLIFLEQSQTLAKLTGAILSEGLR